MRVPVVRLLTLLLGGVLGCSTTRPLAPLVVGEWAVEASHPGAWIETDGATFPVGSLVVGARYGVEENLEGRLALHIPPLALGVVGIDGGGTWHATTARALMPALHLNAELNLFSELSNWGEGISEALRGAGRLSGMAHWEPLGWLWPYVVWDHALVFADGQYVGSALAGFQFRPHARLEISLETGWAAYNIETAQMTQPYVGIASRGALWLGFGVAWRLDPAGGS